SDLLRREIAVMSEPGHVRARKIHPRVVDLLVSVFDGGFAVAVSQAVADQRRPQIPRVHFPGVECVAVDAERAVLLHLLDAAVAYPPACGAAGALPDDF